MNLPLDQRPLVVALAGPNGAGKTTFYHAHLEPAGLHFVNADVLARELDLDLQTPFRPVAVFRNGKPVSLKAPVPKWLKPMLTGHKPRNGAFPGAEVRRLESRPSNHRFMERNGSNNRQVHSPIKF